MDLQMSIESALVVSALGGVLIWLVTRIRPARLRAIAALLLISALATGALAATLLRERPLSETEIPFRPIQVPGDGFVSSDTCRTCHPHEYATWHRSYHHTMTQVATPHNVLGNFDEVELQLPGANPQDPTRFRLGRDEELLWVELDLPDPEGVLRRARRPITMTTGSHVAQAYWYPTGTRRGLAILPFMWHVAEERWIPRSSLFVLPPSQANLPQGPDVDWRLDLRWNHTCVHCHTTRGQPFLSEVDTRAAEFGIACESCHGPAEEHVRANRGLARRYRLHLGALQQDETIVDPQDLDHRRASQVCGVCHGISYPREGEDFQNEWSVGRQFRPGDDLDQTRLVLQPSQGLEPLAGLPEANAEIRRQTFWDDGMVRVKGREYNGLVDTPCFQRGEMSCLSCHAMHQPADDQRSLEAWANHQLKPGMRGDLGCLQCHVEKSAPEAMVAHTHHKVESSGSRCYNCHMPFTSFGLLHGIRSHLVDSPSVRPSLEVGRPNGCNLCHLDKSMAWSATALNEWYGMPIPPMGDVERAVPASIIWLLSGDAGQRSLMTWTMGWEPARQASGAHWMTPFLIQMFIDPYDAVRFGAIEALRKLEPFEDFELDFIAGPQERREAADRALEIYLGLAPPPTGDARNLIVDPEGRLPDDVFAFLLQNRDDRPFALAE